MNRTRPLATRAAALAILAMFALTATALAARSVNYSRSTYRGKTAQGIVITLGPHRSFGRAFRYRARMNCSDGSKFLDSYFTDDVSLRHNHFRVHVSSSRGAVLTTVAGTLQGGTAHGTIRIVERYSEIPNANGDTPLDPQGAIVCDSHSVRWHATARG